jgi:hypothetical protein
VRNSVGMPRAALIVRLIAPCQWIRKVAAVPRLSIGHQVAFLAAAIVIVADAKPRLTVNRMAQLLCGRQPGDYPDAVTGHYNAYVTVRCSGGIDASENRWHS